jgi:hypothetical protein
LPKVGTPPTTRTPITHPHVPHPQPRARQFTPTKPQTQTQTGTTTGTPLIAPPITDVPTVTKPPTKTPTTIPFMPLPTTKSYNDKWNPSSLV